MSASQDDTPRGPDLATEGAEVAAIADGGSLPGHFGGEPVLLVRRGDRILALGGKCTHYGAALADGVFDGACVRCPWHHAAFDAATGEAVHAPAFDPVASFAIETRGGRVFVTGKRAAPAARRGVARAPSSVVIVGGGAAGFAAAEMLRREGYPGPVTLISEDETPPCDRPNLSKDYLAGNAPEEWIPLRAPEWYAENRIELRLGRRVEAIVPSERAVTLDGGDRLEYGALLLATGASPVPLEVPGSDRPHVHTLRTLADSRAIVAVATTARRAVVVGSSFIGLEAAAALAARGLEVHVVGLEQVPMQRVLGADLGGFVRALHESHGVRFHLPDTVTEIGDAWVVLRSGSRLEADLVVVGIGVRPNLALAEKAGLRIDRGVAVDGNLRTSAEGIWAAGDIARWPDPYTGEAIRVEHWVVAERQGQAAARDMLDRGEPFTAAPFFWSQHYDVAINYVGHASSWDHAEVAGTLEGRDAAVVYRRGGRPLAVATVNRDGLSLRVQIALETGRIEEVEAALR